MKEEDVERIVDIVRNVLRDGESATYEKSAGLNTYVKVGSLTAEVGFNGSCTLIITVNGGKRDNIPIPGMIDIGDGKYILPGPSYFESVKKETQKNKKPRWPLLK